MMRKKYPYLDDTYFTKLDDIITKRSLLKDIDDYVNQRQYVKITLLDWNEDPLKDIEGIISSGSLNLNSDSPVRRSCSLSCSVNAEEYSYEDIKSDFSIEKKIFLEIGVKNESDFFPEYPIFWFPQGVFFISDFSINSSSSSTTNISLQFKDKMAKLDGEMGGTFPASVQLDVMDTQLPNGRVAQEKVLVFNIIKELVNHYGGENLNNIVIEDVPLQIKRVLSWNGENPIYLKSIRTPIEGTADEKVFVYENEKGNDDTKYEQGDDIGYEWADFVITSDLTFSAGDNVTTALDKIKSILGNYEYFYDVFGVFHFREIKNYKNTTQGKIVLDNMVKNQYITEINNSKSVYSFEDNTNITSITTTPQYSNIKNDFIVQGNTDNSNDSKSGVEVRYHLAIDKKPEIVGNDPRVTCRTFIDNSAEIDKDNQSLSNMVNNYNIDKREYNTALQMVQDTIRKIQTAKSQYDDAVKKKDDADNQAKIIAARLAPIEQQLAEQSSKTASLDRLQNYYNNGTSNVVLTRFNYTVDLDRIIFNMQKTFYDNNSKITEALNNVEVDIEKEAQISIWNSITKEWTELYQLTDESKNLLFSMPKDDAVRDYFKNSTIFVNNYLNSIANDILNWLNANNGMFSNKISDAAFKAGKAYDYYRAMVAARDEIRKTVSVAQSEEWTYLYARSILKNTIDLRNNLLSLCTALNQQDVVELQRTADTLRVSYKTLQGQITTFEQDKDNAKKTWDYYKELLVGSQGTNHNSLADFYINNNDFRTTWVNNSSYINGTNVRYPYDDILTQIGWQQLLNKMQGIGLTSYYDLTNQKDRYSYWYNFVKKYDIVISDKLRQDNLRNSIDNLEGNNGKANDSLTNPNYDRAYYNIYNELLIFYRDSSTNYICAAFPQPSTFLGQNDIPNVNLIYYFDENNTRAYRSWDGTKWIEVDVVAYFGNSSTERASWYYVYDWRTYLYLQGIYAKTYGLEQNYYAAELEAFWPGTYDLVNQCFWGEKEDEDGNFKYLTQGNYYLDFIEPTNSAIGQFAVGNIGRRTDIIINDEVNCLFTPEIPDIVILNAYNIHLHVGDDSLESQKTIDELRQICISNGYTYTQVNNDIFDNIITGGYKYGALEAITYELYLHTIYQTSVSLTAIPVFYLEPNDRITISDRVSNTYGDYIIQSISYTLGPGANMSISANEASERY